MELEHQEIRLKGGLHRSVSLRVSPTGERSVTKLFHSRHWWRRVGDGLRARREFAMLQTLYRAGLAVPQPLSLRRSPRGWELSTAWVPGALDLLQLTQPGAAPLPAPERLARRLGALLGEAHALGLDHGDLHPGNLLLDAEEQPWLIDLAAARRRDPLPPAVVRRDLTALNGDLREFSTPGLRRRFWVAWQRSFVAHGGRLNPRLRELGTLAEVEALARRHERLLKHSDRWLRPSGLCAARTIHGLPMLVARHARAEAWATGNEKQEVPECGDLVLAGPLPAGTEEELWIDARGPQVERHWRDMGRAWQHGLPTLLPLFLHQGPRPRAGYLAPRGTTPPGGQTALGPALRRALRERELALTGALPWCTPAARQLLGPGFGLSHSRGEGHG